MNMKKLVTLFFLCLLVSAHLTGQISHGGRPLPMTILSTRSGSMFQEMPAFDIAEQLRKRFAQQFSFCLQIHDRFYSG